MIGQFVVVNPPGLYFREFSDWREAGDSITKSRGFVKAIAYRTRLAFVTSELQAARCPIHGPAKLNEVEFNGRTEATSHEAQISECVGREIACS